MQIPVLIISSLLPTSSSHLMPSLRKKALLGRLVLEAIQPVIARKLLQASKRTTLPNTFAMTVNFYPFSFFRRSCRGMKTDEVRIVTDSSEKKDEVK